MDYDSGKRTARMDNHYSRLDDEFLLKHIQQGEHGAFAALVQRHARKFYRIAYRLLFSKNDAEDIVQEAFLKLWEQPKLWNEGKKAKFTTWFYRVVTNLCLDFNRKKRPFVLDEKLQIADDRPGQEASLHDKQQQRLLDRFMRELPEKQQLALNLCFYEGISNREAAEIMGVSTKALQSLIMRAKTTLKEKVQGSVDRGLL